MTTLKVRIARKFLVIKAAKEIKKEIEKAGLDNLKILAENGRSIVGTYLNGCSPQEKATYKRDLGTLLQLGVTPDMLLNEIARQLPELKPTMEGKEGYKESEIKQLELFVRGD